MATVGDFARLQAAIRRAWLKSEFYREHWLEHGVAYQWVPAAPDELDHLPVITKEDILAAQVKRPPWGGNLCVEEQKVVTLKYLHKIIRSSIIIGVPESPLHRFLNAHEDNR